MKKTTKKTGLILLVISGLFILIVGGIAGRLYLEIRKMHPLKTGEVIAGVYAVKDVFVNLYLIQNGDRYIAVDAGNSADRIGKGLETIGVDPDKVTAVLLTHSDSDHVGGLSLFPRAKIYLPREEEQMINGKTKRMLFMKNKLAHDYETLENNQELQIEGIKIKTIATPGHTPGSMCFLIRGALFTGDAMGLMEGQVTEFVELFNMDTPTQRDSLKALADLKGATHIFTAHHGYSDQFQKAFVNWKR